MSDLLNHFVPQFYLRRFVNSKGQLFVYDKRNNSRFISTPRNLAAQKGFYALAGTRSVQIERRLSELESEAAKITESWLGQLESWTSVVIPLVNRRIMSRFFAIQLLRTREARIQLSQLDAVKLSSDELRSLHTSMVWDQEVYDWLARQIHDFIWVFAEVNSEKSLWTSDDPIRVRSRERCLNWPRISDSGAYLAIPMSPQIMLYCYEPTYWEKLKRFDTMMSPVTLTDQLIRAENIPQVGHAERFVFSNQPDFQDAESFCDAHPVIRGQGRDRFS